MANTSCSNQTDADRRTEHLNVLASNFFSLTLELKELIEMHEQLLKTSEMKNMDNDHLKELNSQLISLKGKFSSLEDENKKTESKLKKYKLQNTSVNLHIKKTSENINKIRASKIREEKKKEKIRKECFNLKFKYGKPLKTKLNVDETCLQLMKKKGEASNKVV